MHGEKLVSAQIHLRSSCLPSFSLNKAPYSPNCGKPQRVTAKFIMSATAKIRSRVINGSICKLRGLITFPIYTDIDFSRLQSSILVAETSLQQGRHVWPCCQEHDHVTMLSGAWPCDHATRSMTMWPCYQEHDHVTRLPRAWSFNHSDYQPLVATHLFLWPSPNK